MINTSCGQNAIFVVKSVNYQSHVVKFQHSLDHPSAKYFSAALVWTLIS